MSAQLREFRVQCSMSLTLVDPTEVIMVIINIKQKIR